MLSIKLKPIGKKHQRSFRIIVSEKRSKLQGKFLEDLGWYNPRTKEKYFKTERVKYYLERGAQPTVTVFNMLVSKNIIPGPKKKKYSKKKEEKKKS